MSSLDFDFHSPLAKNPSSRPFSFSHLVRTVLTERSSREGPEKSSLTTARREASRSLSPISEYLLAFTLLNCDSQVQCAGNMSPVWVWRSDPGAVGAKDNKGCGAIELGRNKDAGAQDQKRMQRRQVPKGYAVIDAKSTCNHHQNPRSRKDQLTMSRRGCCGGVWVTRRGGSTAEWGFVSSPASDPALNQGRCGPCTGEQGCLVGCWAGDPLLPS